MSVPVIVIVIVEPVETICVVGLKMIPVVIGDKSEADAPLYTESIVASAVPEFLIMMSMLSFEL